MSMHSLSPPSAAVNPPMRQAPPLTADSIAAARDQQAEDQVVAVANIVMAILAARRGETPQAVEDLFCRGGRFLTRSERDRYRVALHRALTAYQASLEGPTDQIRVEDLAACAPERGAIRTRLLFLVGVVLALIVSVPARPKALLPEIKQRVSAIVTACRANGGEPEVMFNSTREQTRQSLWAVYCSLDGLYSIDRDKIPTSWVSDVTPTPTKKPGGGR